ncbi:MAG: hypothetical protein SH856_06280 [Flavobacteriales bacterium]|nr:hypothetical protein [Flavobacteriales bacterium]
MRKIFLFSAALAFVHSISAQNETELYDEAVVLYHHQWFGGLVLHTNGFGGTFTYAKYRDAKHLRLMGVDAIFMKHEKETKSWNQFAPQDSRSYIYGKTHNFYIIRPFIGTKKILTEKLRKSGVQVAYSYQVGPALGLTKPVYLTIGYPEPPDPDYFLSEKFDPGKHYIDNIYGRASSLLGLDELRFHPGGFFKFSLNFEYSNEQDRLKAIETGIALDAFAKRIPIMSQEILDEKFDGANNHQFFLTLYLNFTFGKKYTD